MKKYITIFTIIVLSTLFALLLLKCDTDCKKIKLEEKQIKLKQEELRLQVEKDYKNSDEYKKEQEHRRHLELIKAKVEVNEVENKQQVSVYKQTDQVIKDRLIEKGTDIGINVGLEVLGALLK